jgi:D-arabinose 1-dehydrogenase-like Zn-dependent alcohol dehydrogenase
VKAIVVTDPAAGTAGMTLVERPEPQAAINDVVVQVHASGFVPTELTWPSTWTDRLGRDRTPSIPGHELAGVVTALGYGTTGLSVGQRVFGLADWYRDGTLADYVAIEARNLAPLPGDVDFTAGASLPISGLTAWQGLFEHGHLRAGQSVLVHGAAGAVGSMVTQLAREAGAYVIAPDAVPTVRRCSTSARRSSSTSRTTPSKMLAESIWCSMSSAATSGSGPQASFEAEEHSYPSSGRPRRGPPTAWRSTSSWSPIVSN